MESKIPPISNQPPSGMKPEETNSPDKAEFGKYGAQPFKGAGFSETEKKVFWKNLINQMGNAIHQSSQKIVAALKKMRKEREEDQ